MKVWDRLWDRIFDVGCWVVDHIDVALVLLMVGLGLIVGGNYFENEWIGLVGDICVFVCMGMMVLMILSMPAWAPAP